MKRRKLHFPFVLVFIFFIFFSTRIYHLTLLPIFNDESTYIYWSRLILATHQHWFISLIGGKGPLFIWLEVIALQLFPHAMYLFSVRLVSVIAGFVSCIGIYQLSILLTKKHAVGLLAMLLYILAPFTLLYDRVALFDSSLSACLIWVVYFTLQTAHSWKIKYALFWGMCMAAAILIKFNAFIVEGVCIVIFFTEIPKKTLQKYWKKILGILLLAFIFPAFAQWLLSLSNGYSAYMHQIIKYTNHATQSVVPVFSFPLFIHNVTTIFSWFFSYLTPFFFTFCLLSLGATIVLQRKLGTLLILLTVVPILLISAINLELSPRYILFTIPFLLIASSYFLIWIFEKNTLFFAYLLCIFLAFFVQFDYLLLVNPIDAPLPKIEHEQFISNDPSGYGLGEIFSYVYTASATHMVSVITLGTEGLFPYAFAVEFWDNPRVHVFPIWPVDNTTEPTIKNAEKESKVFVVIKQSAASPDYLFVKSLHLHIVLVTKRPGNVSSTILAQP